MICNLRLRHQEFNWISNILIWLIYWVQSWHYQKYLWIKGLSHLFWPTLSTKTETPIYRGPQFTAGFSLPQNPWKIGVYCIVLCIKWELVLNKCSLNDHGIIVPGSSINSDLSISIGVAKHKLREILLNVQKIDPLRDILGWSETQDWYPENFFEAHYPV